MTGESSASLLASRRVLIVHEWLYERAGAERCLEELVALVPHADVAVGVITGRARATQPVARRARETWLRLIPGARRHHRWFLPLHPLAFAMIDTSGYDLVISLSHSFGKAVRAKGTCRHLCYCFSPPRYLWDLRETYMTSASIPQKAAMLMGERLLRAADRWAARDVHRFVSISRYVADRVRRAYHRESEVVYPPVRVPAVSRRTRDTFLLSVGRLVPYKRVDLAIAAADLLGMRILVAGDGPERPRLEAMGSRNAIFLGRVSDAEAERLMAECAAFVFCAEEDFGIAPLEANANGAPVVAYGRGGALETMQAGQSAVFFERQEAADVASAIRRCLSHQWDPDQLRANAARFSPDHFRSGMSAQIQSLLQT